MILLWGVPGDTPLAQVRRALAHHPAPVLLVDQRRVLETEIDLVCGETVAGSLRVGNVLVDLACVAAIYLRPYAIDQMPALRGVEAGSSAWRHAVGVVEALLAWVEVTPALVVNPPSAMASNESKPYQARLIETFGFAVPCTLLTTDESAAHEFWAEHGTVIYKSVSGVRSIVSRLTPAHAERLAFVRWCPTQFQEFIGGRDYRIHVVGDEVFACEISSAADDYRYAAAQGMSVDMRACEMPQEISDRCRRMARAFGLPVAGIDLRHDPQRGWYCFEVNPAPAFTYYQHATGHAIDAAIARLLTAARPQSGF